MKSYLGSKFEIKDIGEATYILGIRITRDKDSRLLYLDQEKYLEKVLKKFNYMDQCKALSMPICTRQILSKDMYPHTNKDISEMKKVPYAQAIGSLIYAMTSTRPDICHAVGLVSRYQANLGKAHWQAIKKNFRYLKDTIIIKLCFGLDDLDITRYTNTDFAGDLDDRKSISGNVFLFDRTTVSWLSKK